MRYSLRIVRATSDVETMSACLRPHSVQKTKYFKLEVLVERGGIRCSGNSLPLFACWVELFCILVYRRFCFSLVQRLLRVVCRVCVLGVKPVLTPVDMVYFPLVFVFCILLIVLHQYKDRFYINILSKSCRNSPYISVQSGRIRFRDPFSVLPCRDDSGVRVCSSH